MTDTEFKLLLNEKLCDLADAFLHYYDPCQRRDNTCLVCENIETSTVHCCYRTKWDRQDGDRHCAFLKNRSCGYRNISCKIWLCATAMQANPECLSDFKAIEEIARHYDLVRRPFLGQGYAGRSEELAIARKEKETHSHRDDIK